MKSQNRIKLQDSTMMAIVVMANGNPGAVTALVHVMQAGDLVDPDSAYGWLGTILSLDTQGIYEDKIWTLYSYICKGDVITFIGLVRAVQLGLLSVGKLYDAITGTQPMTDDDIAAVMASVREKLPNFVKTGAKKDAQGVGGVRHPEGEKGEG